MVPLKKMEISRKKTVQLRLIVGGKSFPQGPATRLNLYERFPKPNWQRLFFASGSKCLLLWIIYKVSVGWN